MQTKERTKLRTGLFSDRTAAENAYNTAIKRGYKPEELNVFMTDETRKQYFGPATIKTEMGDKSMEGLAIGGALGGTTLGVIGALVALTTTIVVPGVGLVVAGPLAAGLVGAGAGSIAGGLVGALIGAGLPEERAKIYEKGLKNGGIVVGVKSDRELNDDELLNDWKTLNGKDIY